MKAALTVAALLALLVHTPPVSAQTLLISPRQEPPNSAEGVPRPVRGMSMQTVLERFGEPRERLPAVGEPPITRWVYERFTVYFEGDLTLRALVSRE